jgi:hypothetical protein
MHKAEITSKKGYLFEAKSKDGSFNVGLKGAGATSHALIANPHIAFDIVK